MLPLLSLTLSSFCVADLDSHHVGKPLHQRKKPDKDQREKPDPDQNHTSAKLNLELVAHSGAIVAHPRG